MKLPKLFDLQAKLSAHDKAVMLLRFTIVAIVAYGLGALTHSKIWHFFLGDN